MKHAIAVEFSDNEVMLGRYYVYLYRGRLCVGKAVPCKTSYKWAMENCNTGKVEYPYYSQVIEPDSEYSSVKAEIVLINE